MRALAWCLLSLSLLAPPVQAGADKDFLAAREAYGKGRMSQFERHADRVPADHPLAPYLRYWRLKSNTPTPEAMIGFIERYPDSPLAERLRQDLARRLGKAEDWAGFRYWYGQVVRRDNELQCHDLRARLLDDSTAAGREATRLWRTGQDLPSVCGQLFDELFLRGVLRPEDRPVRMRLAFEKDNLRLVKELDSRAPPEERLAPGLLDRLQAAPESLLAPASPVRAEREAALHALTRIARKDPDRAAALWTLHGPAYPETERRYGWGQIGLGAARLQHPRTLDWFKEAGAELGELPLQWKARALLVRGQWPELYRAIQAMPESLREEPIWRYWKGRALKALGAEYQANLFFAPLSREFHYYGLLAAEELPLRLENRGEDYRLTPEDIRAAEAMPGLRRALLLHELGLKAEATQEWEWALREQDDHRLLAAAELARRRAWYDRAIATAEKTRATHNFDLRYLTPYRALAEANARQHGLDPAWVYGLMRQESRFVDYARSGAGAVGLMQIMPATAQWIASQLGLDRKAHKQVGEPEQNIRFGTYYLRRILDDLQGSVVLATAGYNAGPGRARRWQADTPLEGAVYTENIPYSETREYVKKVLANALYYEQRLGQGGTRLKDRLGIVPARPNAPPPPEPAPAETDGNG